MNNFIFENSSKVYFGEGCVKEYLSSILSAYGDTVMLCYGGGSIKKSSKILVVYYSATGSTKAVAETIADTSGADLFEITPVDPYTSDDLNWTDDNSRVSVEHNDESKRDVPLTKTTPDHWADYDKVFIGYPKMEYSL